MAAAQERRLMRVPRVLSLGLLVLVGALVLSGCASGTGTPDPESTPAASEPTLTPLTAEPLSGTGPSDDPGLEFPIPRGAKSVTIAFECDGGERWAVELGDTMMAGQSHLRGVCDGTQELAWPVTGQTIPRMRVTVTDGVPWVATPTFSREGFVYDTVVTEDCDRFSDVYSAFMNADQGLTLYAAFGEEEWTERVDTAVGDLSELAVTASPSLADALAKVHALASSTDRTVGEALSDDTMSTIYEVTQVCDANQTPLILMGEFGG
ncbi:hypothetical protein ELQ92_14120 [Labedella populi]|uniref:Uncharacterized protein n=1 Tax=Labedella populi TaxID=2498850 RepID=A0A444Q3M4_9MICO|nr:hypothetical protein [Labedella populi]RWZ58440.1 hypothetical protein ELQ92_14120 [Labedella populi]